MLKHTPDRLRAFRSAGLLPHLPYICGFAGGAVLVLTVAQCFRLHPCGLKTQIGMAFAMLFLAFASLGILRLEGASRRRLYIMLLPVSVAMLFRALLLDHAGEDFNSFLQGWCRFFREGGGFRAISNSVGDYNVPYLYFLAFISYIPVRELYLIKLFSLLFDVLLAWGGLRLVRSVNGGGEGGSPGFAPFAAFAVLLLLPTPIINGAYWAQCDAVYTALILHALACALERRTGLSVVLMGLAFSFKLQTVFLLPLWGVLWANKQVKFRELWLFPATYLVTILPAWLLGRPLESIIGIYFTQSAKYLRLTLNAPNMFQFWPYGMESAQSYGDEAGICAAALVVLGLIGLGFYAGQKGRPLDAPAVLAAAVLLSIAIPYLLPHMHERYFFLADVLTVCLACCHIRHLPLTLGIQATSLLSYRVWERTDFNLAIYIHGIKHGMLLEGIAQTILLLYAAWWAVREFYRCCKAGESSD